MREQAWIMKQSWHDLAFLHWKVPLDALRPLVPDYLEIDTYQGQAWIAVVPFEMSRIRVRGLPFVPGTSQFLEINTRTYVLPKDGGKPGVWFHSLDGANRLGVETARKLFRLNYLMASMRMDVKGDEHKYHSVRTDSRFASAEFAADYRPTGPVNLAKEGSLEHWLTERYCLYSPGKDGQLLRGDIRHNPWPIQPGTCEVTTNSMLTALGLGIDRQPDHVLYSQNLRAEVCLPRPNNL
ncbi:MAG: DUF2071 domain-containing protein [Armatimonadota bacterium]